MAHDSFSDQIYDPATDSERSGRRGDRVKIRGSRCHPSTMGEILGPGTGIAGPGYYEIHWDSGRRSNIAAHSIVFDNSAAVLATLRKHRA